MPDPPCDQDVYGIGQELNPLTNNGAVPADPQEVAAPAGDNHCIFARLTWPTQPLAAAAASTGSWGSRRTSKRLRYRTEDLPSSLGEMPRSTTRRWRSISSSSRRCSKARCRRWSSTPTSSSSSALPSSSTSTSPSTPSLRSSWPCSGAKPSTKPA